jgi:hypothetical protein
MQVKTQPFKEALEIKSDGICFDVYGNGAKRLGDLAVTRGGLVWNKVAGGKPMRGQGINVRWEEFINWVQTRKAGAGNGGVMKLPSQKGAQQTKPAGKSGLMQKPTAKSASAQKPASKGAPALKSGSKGAISVKTAARSAASMKPASKTGETAKLPSITASPAKPALQNGGAAKRSAQNGSPVKLPTAKPQQSKAKAQTSSDTVKKPVAANASTAARGKKAN